MKILANDLIAPGQNIYDDELALYILGRLGLQFEVVFVNITSRDFVTL